MEISVIICTYNPRQKYLNRVLSALKNQSLDYERWELLIVDNNSKELVSERFDIKWHPNGIHIVETEQGLTPARIRGIRESKADLLVFVDDDNILDSNYLKKVVEIALSKPFIGAFGGSIRPEYEIEPAPHLKRHTGKLALREVEREVISNLYINMTTPYGAGMAIKKTIANKYVDKLISNKAFQLDRKGNSLMSSGDIDLAYTSIDLGYLNGLFKELDLTHLIPKERVELSYLVRLRMGINLSGMLMRYYRFGEFPVKPKYYKYKMLIKRIFLPKHEWLMVKASHDALNDFYKMINK